MIVGPPDVISVTVHCVIKEPVYSEVTGWLASFEESTYWSKTGPCSLPHGDQSPPVPTGLSLGHPKKMTPWGHLWEP